jgi:hypothetical protein
LLELMGCLIRRPIIDKNDFRECFQEAGSLEGRPQWFKMLRHIIGGDNECDRGTCYHSNTRLVWVDLLQTSAVQRQPTRFFWSLPS